MHKTCSAFYKGENQSELIKKHQILFLKTENLLKQAWLRISVIVMSSALLAKLEMFMLK